MPRREEAGSPIVPQHRRRSRHWFFIAFAATVAVLVFTGFSRTFFVPLAHGTFAAPWFVHVHGSLFFAWVVLLLVQAILVAGRRLPWHRRLGWVGAGLIPLMVVSGVRVAFWATTRDLAAHGDAVVGSFFGELADMVLFASFAMTSIATRRRPESHKRWILLATLALLGAAVSRIPVLGEHSDLVTFGLLASIAVFDFAALRHLHAVTLCGGLALVIGILVQTPIGATVWWLATGRSLLALFTA